MANQEFNIQKIAEDVVIPDGITTYKAVVKSQIEEGREERSLGYTFTIMVADMDGDERSKENIAYRAFLQQHAIKHEELV